MLGWSKVFSRILITACLLSLSWAAELQPNQILLGDKVVTGVLSNGTIRGDEVVASDSHSLTVLHYELTPGGEPAGNTNATSSEPRLNLLLLTGTGDGPSPGKVKGFYGEMYMARNWTMPNVRQTNRVDILASADGTRIAVMVLENGPFYTSTNSGLTWRVTAAPGQYRFPLVMQTNGSGFVATATIEDLGAKTNTAPVNGNWYALGTSGDGKGLVLNNDVSMPTPVLSIKRSGDGILLSWPAKAGDFLLQSSSNLISGPWFDVTNVIATLGDRNEVVGLLRKNGYQLR